MRGEPIAEGGGEEIDGLAESERYRLLVESVPDYAIYLITPDGRVATWNAGAERTTGFRAEEIVGAHVSTFLPAEDRDSGRAEGVLEVAAREGRCEEEGWRERRDGTRFWAHVTTAAIRDDAGRLLGFSRVARDLTERHRREVEHDRLLRNERVAHEQVATVLSRITDAFFALDTEWRFTYMNDATRAAIRAILGHDDPDRVIGTSFWEAVPQLRGTRFEEAYREAMRTQRAAHFVEYADRLGVWFDVHAYPSPGGLSVYFRDVTQQRQAEDALERERRRLRAVLDALPVGVWISDAQGKLLEANEAARTIWGGRAPLPEGPQEYGAYRGWRPDTGEPLRPDDWALARALSRGETVSGEEVQIEAFDGTRRTALTYALPIRDPSGEVSGGVVVMVDVTERHRLLEEARGARRAAERASRAKSEFLAMMSHEIRTPINAIMGYSELLELGIAGPINSQQRSQLQRVRSSSAHLLGLVNDVLDLAKVEAGRMSVERERAVAQHAVDAALALVRPQAAERGLALESGCAAEPPVAYCGDEDRVRQILVNLLSNAVKFTAPGGRVSVACGAGAAPASGTALVGAGPWVWLRVEDTGVGIAPDALERVFQPFVQAEHVHTRKHGGTGLGLTISRQLARLMGGDLTAESEVGRGSAFTLWLPAPDPRDAEQPLASRGLARPAVVAAVGRALLDAAEPIMDAYARRLREEPDAFPGVAALTESDLKDHGGVFLADIGQSLAAWRDADLEPEALLRDGGKIQQVISELHGAQRARLGWDEPQIAREFQILREEIASAVRARVTGAAPDEVSDGLGALMRFVGAAERVSCKAVRRALE